MTDPIPIRQPRPGRLEPLRTVRESTASAIVSLETAQAAIVEYDGGSELNEGDWLLLDEAAERAREVLTRWSHPDTEHETASGDQ